MAQGGMAIVSSESVVGKSTPSNSTIGTDLVINGKEIRLDGQVIGDIYCGALVLGENAKLEGSAVAEEVVISGRVIGSVRAVRLTLRAGCHVEGDLLCQTLAMEQGAHFDGRSCQSTDPLPQPNTIAAREKVSGSTNKALSAIGSDGQRLGTPRAGVVQQNLAST
jgi:cytoskeletal protein CcmA (bactofilin family)